MSTAEEIRSHKLQPIYNALERAQWRQAVRLCEQRDVEKWLTTKALKANGLWRLGKYDEGIRLCLEVQRSIPTDEDTLAAMSCNYRMMNRREQVVPMFEAAVNARPGEPPLLKELFMCYVRAKQYLKAQQTATKLYKVDSKGGKFIIWAAATMLIQAERKDRTASAMTLPLAEKLTVKVLQEKAAKGCRPVGEELRLYLDILNLQGKHREALEALGRFEPEEPPPDDSADAASATAAALPTAAAANGGVAIEDESSLDNGSIVNMQELERLEMKAALYEKLGGGDDLERAEEIVQGLVRRSADQWSYYVSLLDLIDRRNGLSESKALGSGRPGEWPPALVKALALMRHLQQENPRWRGPFLAEMELLKRAIGWFGFDSLAPFDAAESCSNGVSNPKEAVEEQGQEQEREQQEREQQEQERGENNEEEEEGQKTPSTLWSVLCRCIASYMAVFSAKLCCFRDMRPYLTLFVTVEDAEYASSKGLVLGLEQLKRFFRREAAESKVDAEGLRETAEVAPLDQEQRDIGVKRLHRYICACQSRHLLGDHTVSDLREAGDAETTNGGGSTDAGSGNPGGDEIPSLERCYREVVRELTTQYRATLHLNLGSEGGQREVQHGDELVILAAITLLKLCNLFVEGPAASGSATEDIQSGKVKAYLGKVEVACLLEAAMSCSPYNHHLKIMAMDVYRELGSFERGLTIYEELDVKQIQVDTLSYLILRHSHRYGLFGEVQGQCKAIRAVHRNCSNETAEHVARAVERGNYSKGAEIDRFQREKLDLSLQLALAKAEKVSMDVILDHQTCASAARYLQEEALSDRGGGAAFPGDDWLEALKENMDYSVQTDRCCAISKEEEAVTERRRRGHLKASLKRRLLANETLKLALKGGSSADVDRKATELEHATMAAAAAAAAAASDEANRGISSGAEDAYGAPVFAADGDGNASVLPWQMMADASRALALTHHGLVGGSGGGAGAGVGAGAGGSRSSAAGQGEDAEKLGAAAEAMARAGEKARAYKGMVLNCPRYVCALEGGEGTRKVYQAEAPLTPEWLTIVSKALGGGLVFTCVLLQAIGAELPADKKKKGGGKSKGKGKGKKSQAGDAGVGSGGGATPAVSRLQEALLAFGREVSELLRAMSVALKSEISAKLEPAHPGEALTQLLKGELGAVYELAIDVLWEGTEGGWCEEGVVKKAVVGITGGQAVSCQRLLSVVTENLAMLQRWEKKG